MLLAKSDQATSRANGDVRGAARGTSASQSEIRIDVDRRRRRHVLQARLGQADVPAPAQSEPGDPLRQRPLHPCPHHVLRLLKRHLPYHESDHILNIASNLFAGGRRLEHLSRPSEKN